MKVMKEISRRFSPNGFSNKDIEKDKIDAIIEAARLAPSAFNSQPWNYVFISRDHELRKDLEGCLNVSNGWAKEASHLVVVFARSKDDGVYDGIPYHIYDSGLSVMSLVLEAERQGLRTHQMAGFNSEKAAALLDIPKGYDVVVMIAVGYEDKHLGVLDEVSGKLKEKVLHQRKRKEVGEFVWFGKVEGK